MVFFPGFGVNLGFGARSATKLVFKSLFCSKKRGEFYQIYSPDSQLPWNLPFTNCVVLPICSNRFVQWQMYQNNSPSLLEWEN